MSYIDKTLVPGEKVVYTTKLHWIVMLGHLFACLIFLAGAGYLGYYLYDNRATLQPGTLHTLEIGLAVLFFLALLFLIMGSVRRSATEMAVTTRRVVVKTGITSRRTIEMLLNKIETIEVSEPTMGRVLGYGSITMIGTGGTSEPFHKIAHPLEFRSFVQQEIERLTPGDTAPRPV
jgi:uncharacterized membrane protein YdbT with pleckstrin-like domain